MTFVEAILALCAVAMLTMAGCHGGPGALAERTGLVTMRGKPLTLLGNPVKVGDPAPPFRAVANDLSSVDFAPDGKVYVLSVVPSLDTPVCNIQSKRFNDEASKLADVKMLTISMDLPFAQKRWCGAEGIKNLQTLSDYRDRAFGQAYGVSIKENGLLARSVFVVGKDGAITYVQIVPELTQEPDYQAAIAAAKMAAK
jgi:thiol peroxidase